jgi:hypothetical protein
MKINQGDFTVAGNPKHQGFGLGRWISMRRPSCSSVSVMARFDIFADWGYGR